MLGYQNQNLDGRKILCLPILVFCKRVPKNLTFPISQKMITKSELILEFLIKINHSKKDLSVTEIMKDIQITRKTADKHLLSLKKYEVFASKAEVIIAMEVSTALLIVSLIWHSKILLP